MKTIKQIADEIGVTKAALQKRIGRGSLYPRLSPYIILKNNTKYIDETGEKIVKEAFDDKPFVKPVDMTGIDADIDGNTRAQPSEFNNALVELLREQQADLRQQLEIKDKQIADLNETIKGLNESVKNLSQSINVAHHNELAETIIDSLPPPEPSAPVKVSLWDKIFRRK